MLSLRFPLALLTSVALSATAVAAHGQRYKVPRTEHGHPDFQGVWATAFLTMMERPPGVDYLVATPDQAQALAGQIREHLPAVIDPDVQLHDISQLAVVKGEPRTSMIVNPSDGRIPYSQAGLDMAARVRMRAEQYDDPELRPLSERCLENLGYAPMRSVPVFLPRQIVQTSDYVLISSEDAFGLRKIHLTGERPPASLRTVEGYSIGRWEGDTLVVETTHFRTDEPARTSIGRPLLLGPQSKVTERFTRVSETELFYQFTVEDDQLYMRPWTGEFSMTRQNVKTYEYACHEGNYSLTNILRGGQAEAARLAEANVEPQ